MDGAVIAGIAAPLVALAGTYLGFRTSKRSATTDAAQRQIDQIQEDRENDREEFERASKRFAERQGRLENRVESVETMNRIASDYILQLRYHIAEGHPPPPPPFPAALTKGMGSDR